MNRWRKEINIFKLDTMFQASNQLILSDETFRELRDFIYKRTGIYFQDNKKYLLEGRIGKRLQVLKIPDYNSYLRLLNTNELMNGEIKYLYDAITINETFFFRNNFQFQALEKAIIPEIVKSRRDNQRGKLRIWSAASSSGEEAYTIAMIYLERLKPQFPNLEIDIVGTDISSSVIETAKNGVYREYSVRNMPQDYFRKYFIKDESRFFLKPDVKKLVRFDILNLYDQSKLRLMRNFDVIFCCNVLIYFDMKSKIQVISDLYNSLNFGGYLFIGYAESLHGISNAFKLVNFPKTVAYKKE